VRARVLQGKLTVVTTARQREDLRTPAARHRVRLHAGDRRSQEAHYVVDELARAKVWVMVGAPSADRVAGARR